MRPHASRTAATEQRPSPMVGTRRSCWDRDGTSLSTACGSCRLAGPLPALFAGGRDTARLRPAVCVAVPTSSTAPAATLATSPLSSTVVEG